MLIQGSIEWHLERMGKITGTRFSRATGSIRVKNSLIAEISKERELLAKGGFALDEHLDKIMAVDSAAMAWGRDHEDQALSAFELAYDMDVDKSGFIVHPDYDFIGVSLDGLVRDNDSRPHAIAEVKCPYNPENHANTLILGMPEQHFSQVQGNAWVACQLMGYFISFDSRAEVENRLYVQAIDVDFDYIGRLEAACIEINDCVMKGQEISQPENPVLF